VPLSLLLAPHVLALAPKVKLGEDKPVLFVRPLQLLESVHTFLEVMNA